MEMKEYFQSWSEKVGMTPTELEEEYKQIKEEMKAEHPTDTEEVLTNRTFLRQQAYHSKQFKSANTKDFEAVLIGTGGTYDQYKKERKEATEKGFMIEIMNPKTGKKETKPIFFSKRYDWKFKNKNDGTTKDVPIPDENDDESIERWVYGVFKQKGTEQWKRGMIYLVGRKLCNSLPPLFVTAKTKLNISDDNAAKEELTLNSAKSTTFMYDKEAKPVDFVKMAEQLFPQNFIPFEELAGIRTSDTLPMKVLLTSGIVTNINKTQDTVKSNAVDIMKKSVTAEDMKNVGNSVVNQTFWIPKDLPLNFGIGSEVVVVAQKSTRPNKTGEEVASYNGLGIYTVYNTGPKKESESIAGITEAEEEEVDGSAWRGGQ